MIKKKKIYINLYNYFMVRVISTSIDEEIYEKIKRKGYKFSQLIIHGLNCLEGKCTGSSVIAELIKEKDKEIETLKIKIKDLEKQKEENRSKKIDIALFTYIISVILEKYEIDLTKEINEIVKDEDVKKKLIDFVNKTINRKV